MARASQVNPRFYNPRHDKTLLETMIAATLVRSAAPILAIFVLSATIAAAQPGPTFIVYSDYTAKLESEGILFGFKHPYNTSLAQLNFTVKAGKVVAVFERREEYRPRESGLLGLVQRADEKYNASVKQVGEKGSWRLDYFYDGEHLSALLSANISIRGMELEQQVGVLVAREFGRVKVSIRLGVNNVFRDVVERLIDTYHLYLGLNMSATTWFRLLDLHLSTNAGGEQYRYSALLEARFLLDTNSMDPGFRETIGLGRLTLPARGSGELEAALEENVSWLQVKLPAFPDAISVARLGEEKVLRLTLEVDRGVLPIALEVARLARELMLLPYTYYKNYPALIIESSKYLKVAELEALTQLLTLEPLRGASGLFRANVTNGTVNYSLSLENVRVPANITQASLSEAARKVAESITVLLHLYQDPEDLAETILNTPLNLAPGDSGVSSIEPSNVRFGEFHKVKISVASSPSQAGTGTSSTGAVVRQAGERWLRLRDLMLLVLISLVAAGLAVGWLLHRQGSQRRG